MARIVIVGMFACFTLIASPAQAGDLWAWIKELSGPGPFHGAQLDVRLACVGTIKAPGDYTTAEAQDRRKEAQADRFTPGTGVFYSACRGARAHSPVALGATFRSLHNSPTGSADYAGGNRINLTTLGVAAMWRPIDGIEHPKLDVLDIGVAVSRYWFTNTGAQPGSFTHLTGMMIEPLRLEFHAPSFVRNAGGWSWLASVPFVQLSWVIFPAGFGPNAFGPDLVGEKAQRLPAEWVPAGNVFFDITPIVRRIRGR